VPTALGCGAGPGVVELGVVEDETCFERRAVSVADTNVVKIKYGSRKMGIETALENGPHELRKTQRASIAAAATLQPQLHSSAMQVAQAMKDLTLL
jgi:hypothetical protein